MGLGFRVLGFRVKCWFLISVGVLNCAKLRRNYSAPPDSFGGAELCEIARAKKKSENNE